MMSKKVHDLKAVLFIDRVRMHVVFSHKNSLLVLSAVYGSSTSQLQSLKNKEKMQKEKTPESSTDNTKHEAATLTTETPARVKLFVLLGNPCDHLLLLPAHWQSRNLTSGDLWFGCFGVHPDVCLKKYFSPLPVLRVHSVGEKPSTVACCTSRCSTSDPFNPLLADGDFRAGHLGLGTTLPSPEECSRSSGICSRSRCFSVMSLGRTANGIYDRTCSGPSAGGAPRESLSVWSSFDDSGSVHGSGDEHDEISGCGETGSGCTYRSIIRVGENMPFAAICAPFSKFVW